MDYKEYLNNQNEVQLVAIAARMWPNNKNPKVYLSMKLSGKRPWTEEDNANAKKAINDLGKRLSKL